MIRNKNAQTEGSMQSTELMSAISLILG